MKNGAGALPVAVATELVALYGAGKWPQLVTAAGRVTTRYPRHLLGWQASSKAFLQMGKVPEAIDMLSQVVKLAPDEADGYNDLGNALHAIGRTDEAVASYSRAVSLNPRSPEAHSNRTLRRQQSRHYPIFVRLSVSSHFRLPALPKVSDS